MPRPNPREMLGLAWDLWWTGRTAPRGVAVRQAQRFHELVAFARTHSRFYADHYRNVGPRPELHDLPPVTKAVLIEHFDAWVTDPAVTLAATQSFTRDATRVGEDFLGKYMVWTTSGSSGIPGIFLHDAREERLTAAVSLVRGYLGVTGPREWIARLGNIPRQGERQAWVYVTQGHFSATAVVRRRQRNPHYAAQSRLFSLSQSIPQLVAQLNAYQPTLLGSYPGFVGLLAQEQMAGRLAIQPRVILVGGEGVDDDTRARIHQAFGTWAQEQYATAEAGPIAYRCREGWFHVNADWVIVEPVDADGKPTPPGQASRAVLVTNLAGRVQPIIRYELNDSVVVRPDPCPCGNRLTALRVHGRPADALIFPAPDGTRVLVPTMNFAIFRSQVPGLHRSQLIQTAPSTLVLRLEVAAGYEPDRVWTDAERQLKQFALEHGLAPWTIVRSDEPISVDPATGKLRQVWSTVPRTSPVG